ncbi:MAG: GntR family transcriptional regulator [Epulopiscium sp. Nele67-Bin002]|nr:MAG: GntR family transcriptional regulator [Epulopiscium sp. Nele67-Bin001]OON92614.1 MAG: GntR family transcriptional regulator [Epulopiscium sp. Nele67-Bin002]
MCMKFNSTEPIFTQIASLLEDEIVQGYIEEDTQIPSTTELSKMYAINPATILKGINILVGRKIIYKKRGIGMFVSIGAREVIMQQRKEIFSTTMINELMNEGNKLGISKQEIIEQIVNWGEDI